MKMQMMATNDLIPYVNNPRQNDDAVDAVASSIKNFGFKVPIVIDGQNEIVNGHTRLKAAKKLGLDEVPVIVADDLTPEQIKAFRLADNKVGEIAEWDDSMLLSELEELAELEFDMTQFGFDDLDFADETAEIVEDEFDEELPEEPKARLGDVYQLGSHRLMCGDSTDVEAVKTLMGGQLADMLITDPPYNVDYSSKDYGRDKASKTRVYNEIQNDKMSDDDFLLFITDVFTAGRENMKKGASFYCWYSDAATVEFMLGIKNAGLSVKENLIWVKNNIVLGRQDYQHKHEPCLYGWVENAAHSWYSDRKQTTILNFDKPVNSQLHPTMKPILLFDYQIKNSSKSGDNVLDLFGGSGTTLMACEQNGRCGYLMELDPRYVDVIIRRWEEFTGEKAELVGNINEVTTD